MCENLTLVYYFKGSGVQHIHNIYDNRNSAINTANRYYGINSVRAIVLYDDEMNIIYRRGDI